jgi:hypothetical protein
MIRTTLPLLLLLLTGCAAAPQPAPTQFERCMSALVGPNSGQNAYVSDRLRAAEWCANYEKSGALSAR